jgi:hypothetical protein
MYARGSIYGQTLDAQLDPLRADRCTRLFGETASVARFYGRER